MKHLLQIIFLLILAFTAPALNAKTQNTLAPQSTFPEQFEQLVPQKKAPVWAASSNLSLGQEITQARPKKHKAAQMYRILFALLAAILGLSIGYLLLSLRPIKAISINAWSLILALTTITIVGIGLGSLMLSHSQPHPSQPLWQLEVVQQTPALKL